MAFGRSWDSFKKSDKVQYLNFVIYDKQYLDELLALHIPFAWVLHDRDTNENGEMKKSHFHILINYGNSTTINNWKRLLGDIPSNHYAEVCGSPRGYWRYMIHEDDPNKTQYDKKERHCECGFSEADLLSNTDVNFLIRWLNHFIIANSITEYDDLLIALDETGHLAEYFVVIRNTIHFEKFLKARRIKSNAELKRQHDKASGQLPELGEHNAYNCDIMMLP